MKYLDKFKNFFKKDNSPIYLWAKSIDPTMGFSIVNNEINFLENKKLNSDVKNIFIKNEHLVNNELPYKINICYGNFRFDRDGCELKSLKNTPNEIYGNFCCAYKNLKSLEGGPKIVHGEYRCDHNELTSLKGIAKIYGHLDCSNNKITHFNDIEDYSIFNNIDYSGNPISYLISLINFSFHFEDDEFDTVDKTRNNIFKYLKGYDVINGNRINIENLKEVYYMLDIEEKFQYNSVKNLPGYKTVN